MKKKRRSAGFSLVELMLAVAIVATLCGFGFVSVIQQRKNLKIMEASETAKEIFLAAQEHLSMAAAQGRLRPDNPGFSGDDNALLGLSIRGLDATKFGNEVTDTDGNTYVVFDDKSVSVNAANGSDITAQRLSGAGTQSSGASASVVILPMGAVDEFILNQRYAISYNAEAYRALDVFYTEDNDYVFRDNVWGRGQTWTEGKQEVQDHPGNFQISGDTQKPVIMGWYGEDALLYDADGVSDAQKPSKPQGIKPGLDLINGPVLFAVVSLDEENYDYANVQLKIEGADGGSITIPFTDPDRVKFYKNENGVKYYIVILDDVTAPELGFGDLSPDDPTKPIPAGSDIQVTVEAKGHEKGSSIDLEANSETKECNSLFADNSSVFAEDSDSEKAHIKNFRHLQNLSNLTPGVTNAGGGKPIEATLDNDLEWGSFHASAVSVHNICQMLGVDVSYQPVEIEAYDADFNFNFNGNDKTIRNLKIENADNY